MTEKSEDQVIKFCIDCYAAGNVNDELMHVPNCEMRMVEYIPHSKYLALEAELNSFKEVYNKDITSYIAKSVHEKSILQADLVVAVEALTSLVGHTEATLQFPHKDKIDLIMSLDRAKEALGKIGVK